MKWKLGAANSGKFNNTAWNDGEFNGIAPINSEIEDITRLGGEFRTPALEAAFRSEQGGAELSRFRRVWSCALAFIALYALFDYWLLSAAQPWSVLGPRLLILAVGWLAVGATWTQFGHRHLHALGFAAMLLIAACYGVVLYERGHHANVFGGAMLLVIGSYLFSPNRFWMAYISGFAFTLAALIASWRVQTVSAWMALSYLLPANLLAALVLVNMNRLSRIAWMRQRDLVQEVSHRKRVQQQLAEAHARGQSLLNNTLPMAVARQLQASPGLPLARNRPMATVLFADLVGFTELAHRLEANRLLSVLNELFTRFDGLAESHGIEKIKTVGDAYMAAAGVTGEIRNQQDRAISLSLALMHACDELAKELHLPLRLRIGIHCGPLVAGVIGSQRLSFDIWGETVNISSRLQSAASPGRILVSDTLRRACTGPHLFSAPRWMELRGCGTVAVCDLYSSRKD